MLSVPILPPTPQVGACPPQTHLRRACGLAPLLGGVGVDCSKLDNSATTCKLRVALWFMIEKLMIAKIIATKNVATVPRIAGIS